MQLYKLFANVVVKCVDGHYEAYADGKFIVSGDSFLEVCKELSDLEYKYIGGDVSDD